MNYTDWFKLFSLAAILIQTGHFKNELEISTEWKNTAPIGFNNPDNKESSVIQRLLSGIVM
ncbi:MAG: hypothetical protein HY738_05230 [Bacteroidia bacterium]|nr:hypothetical protein [Bacteroidia bacterium]